MICFHLLLFHLLLPPLPALPSLPEIFTTHPLSHANFSALSATTLTLHPSGDIFIAGLAYPIPLQFNNLSTASSSPPFHPTSLPPHPFIARVSASANLTSFFLLNSTEQTIPVALVYHAAHLFIAGTTTGTVHTAVRTTAPGKPSVFVAKVTLDGRYAWKAPLVFGSGGHDAVSTLVLDTTTPRPQLFVAGSVGGNAFPVAQRNVPDVTAVGQANSDTGGSSGADGSYSEGVHAMAQFHAMRMVEGRKDLDLFIAKVDVRSGALEAVQLPLERDNSAEAVAVHGDRVFVAVNSYVAAPFDPEGTSALYEFDARNLKFRAVHLPNESARGAFVHTIAADASGGVYLGGFCMRGHRIMDGFYTLKKYASERGVVEWEKVLGNFSKVEPQVSLAIGKRSGNVYVAGHATGLYRSEDDAELELIRLPVTVFSAQGREVVSWERTSPFPEGYEEIAQIVLDEDENVVYTGRWLNPEDGMYDATVGSFGAGIFAARAIESDADVGVQNSKVEGRDVTALTIGSVLLAVGVALVVVGFAVFVWNRGERKHVENDAGYGSNDGSDVERADESLDKMDMRSSLRVGFGGPRDSDGVRMMTMGSEMRGISRSAGGSSGPV